MVKNMSEIATTTVNKPPFTPDDYPYRTTSIPSEIVKMFDVKLGDRVSWEIISLEEKTIKIKIVKCRKEGV